MDKRPLIVILGPTAAGKTEIAIQLAKKMDGEIISADSRLFYRGMDIGTAKPSAQEQALAPHHLIDVANPDEVWSLALFHKEAQKAIDGVHQRKHLPFLVGGTGQYIWAVIEGWEIPRVEPDQRMRAALEIWAKEIGRLALHQQLAHLDPLAAKSIDPHNQRRTIRALEVILSTGRLFSNQKQRGASPYKSLILGLKRPRNELYARIDARIQSMIESGFALEVRSLLARGYSPDLPTLSAIGYKEMIQVEQGEITLNEAIVQMKRRTRVFVRRQANWFKENDPQITWFAVNDHTIQNMQASIENWLSRLATTD
ncbi:MAG: tRNA (adenosine(37)-N6)-dimethylallyltransferase MiaA [Anaerolineales bacterium]|nr:tRNA (adenosine(37)-N6)-dimethylallyltransferase MiaA [Anaerolineales bacterium]